MMKLTEKHVRFPAIPGFYTDIEKIPEPIITDPNGSYTGLTKDGEKPVQDADDL